MGAEILIDYENLPRQSSNIRNSAVQINKKLAEVYNKIGNMHENWYGMRYNDLVRGLNSIIPQLNQFLSVIETDLPYVIEAISNNFSEVDIKQRVTTEQKTNIQNIQPIPVVNDIGLRYLDVEVENVRKEVVADLNEIRGIMEDIGGTVGQLVMECDGSEEFKSQFSKLKESFNQSLSNIENTVVEYMNKTKIQIEKAEKANTVS